MTALFVLAHEMQTLVNCCPTTRLYIAQATTAAPGFQYDKTFYEYDEATEISPMDGVGDGIPVFPSTPFWPMSIIQNHLLTAMIITINIQVNRKAGWEYGEKSASSEVLLLEMWTDIFLCPQYSGRANSLLKIFCT